MQVDRSVIPAGFSMSYIRVETQPADHSVSRNDCSLRMLMLAGLSEPVESDRGRQPRNDVPESIVNDILMLVGANVLCEVTNE